jgi:hypothetical protein
MGDLGPKRGQKPVQEIRHCHLPTQGKREWVWVAIMSGGDLRGVSKVMLFRIHFLMYGSSR